jgi:hypothetical protein
MDGTNRKANQGDYPQDVWSGRPCKCEHSGRKDYRCYTCDVKTSFLAFAVDIFTASTVSRGFLIGMLYRLLVQCFLIYSSQVT